MTYDFTILYYELKIIPIAHTLLYSGSVVLLGFFFNNFTFDKNPELKKEISSCGFLTIDIVNLNYSRRGVRVFPFSTIINLAKKFHES